jgi:hypothetical protein
MQRYRPSKLAPVMGRTPVHAPLLMEADPRLPRVGELVALHLWKGPRLWVGRVRSAYDKAVTVAFDAIASRPAALQMPQPGERIGLWGLAGVPIDARATVRGHKQSVLLLRDVVAGEQGSESAHVSVPVHGRLWCEERGGTGCGVEVLERFPDGLCISAPAWARPGDEVELTGPARTGGPVPALVVGNREDSRGRGLAHVAFMADPSDDSLRRLLEGLATTG